MKMKKMSSVCDYFVIASGTSTTHVRAISDNILRVMRQRGQRAWHAEGEREASWILLDYGDVVCHVFLDQTRRFYELEKLWAGGPIERFEEPGPKKKARRPKAGSRRAKIKKRKK